MQLRPYQLEAAEFLLRHDRAMVLAPVGAGKTALTLSAIADLLYQGHAHRVLVLAPKRVAESVWPVEQTKWEPAMRLAVAIGAPHKRSAALVGDAQVVVSNYDNLQWLASHPAFGSFDAVVFDELTRLKNSSGQRFKALAKALDHINIRWGLTGSFTSNGLEDVFGQCKIIDQSLLGRSKGAFLQQYFYCANRDYDDWVPLPGALEKVMAKLRPVTYLLEPGAYADKLPPLNVVPVSCKLESREPYDEMRQRFVVQFGKDEEAIAASAAAVTNKLQQMSSGFVYLDGRRAAWFSHHKFDRLSEILEENQRAPTLVVYNYIEELAELKRRYGDRLQTLDDEKAIERWNAGTIEILAAHPKSAGHGLNLQAGGCHMVFLSLPWSLELYEQVIGRLHRSGQTKPVWVYVMMSERTIDQKIMGALNDKRNISNAAIEELR